MIESADEFIELRDNNDPRSVHDFATEDVWTEVIDRFPDYKEWVVLNKTIPLAILYVLADDLDPAVRSSVATKRKCDRHLFEKLSRDEYEVVRSAVAHNKSTPVDIL